VNAHKQRYLKELESANQAIRKADALIDYGDGTFGVDPTLMSESFLSFYQGLLSAGYANSFI
jgi:hypothetical protein